RMPNTGIVKAANIVLNKDDSEVLISVEVENVSQKGMMIRSFQPGDFRYDVEVSKKVTMRILFNNDNELNLEAVVVWFEDKPEHLDLGLYFSGPLW
ncbi:MAG: PilZ domain-containing protein, partial [Spirochaetota bacterium]|nr:PilZ domain-containing protein [Spirochaetota bacterium]